MPRRGDAKQPREQAPAPLSACLPAEAPAAAPTAATPTAKPAPSTVKPKSAAARTTKGKKPAKESKGKGQVADRRAEDELEGKHRRVRYGELPEVPEEIAFPYAKAYDEDLDVGEAVAWMMNEPEWEETIGARCDEVEAARPRRGPKPSYTTRELEATLFFQIVSGLRTYKAARDRLGGDRGNRSRVALGLDQPREKRCPQELQLYAGVPCEATMTRHRKRFPYDARLQAYEAYFDRLRARNAQDSSLWEGMRILGIDGSAQPTHLTCPIVVTKTVNGVETKEIVNAEKITCPEGAFVSSGDKTKRGHGFAVAPLHCINGLPWAYQHGGINLDERRAAVGALQDYAENVLPHVRDRRLGVLTADAGFTGNDVRRAAHAAGLIDNIHHVSHAKGRDSTIRDRDKNDGDRLRIEGHPKWHANGHRELICECGNNRSVRRPALRKGKAVVRLEGTCDTCGSITITAGQWRVVPDNKRTKAEKDKFGTQRFVKVTPDIPKDHDSIDWSFGNPLTYHDLVAAQYGDMRFGHGEGLNGMMVTRWKLLKTKGYYRNKAQAQLHCLQVFCAMHGLTMRQRARQVQTD